MEFDWAAKNYKDLVNNCLGYRKVRRPRGVIKALALKIGCHSTFIAQVLSGRADLSLEQGLSACEHFAFSAEETEHFLNLLSRDRAGTQRLKRLYQSKIDVAIKAHMEIASQFRQEDIGLTHFEQEYFGDWLYPCVHALTQMIGGITVAAVARALGFSPKEVTMILERLGAMGLVRKEKESWFSKKSMIHLPDSARSIRAFHLSWKGKIFSDLQMGKSQEGTHYSGVITVTENDYQKIRSVLVKALGSIRRVVEDSESEKAYIVSIDCYRLFS